jgi:hypothetical protein
MNMTDLNPWITITEQYNDNANLKAARPQVEINPAINQAAHVWIAEGVGNNGVAMFDAENSGVGMDNYNNSSDNMVYPNPATSEANLLISNLSDQGTIAVYDVTGKLVESRPTLNHKAGNCFENFDVRQWQNGLYYIIVSSNNKTITHKLIVSH